MRTHARHGRGDRTKAVAEEEHGCEDVLGLALADDDADELFDEEQDDEVRRLRCPDCARPIALLPDADVFPQHAVCATPWNPFGLTVCFGSGRAAGDAAPADGPARDGEQELAVVVALPAGLDWRTQPFSHVGGPGSRPLRATVSVPVQAAPVRQRRAA